MWVNAIIQVRRGSIRQVDEGANTTSRHGTRPSLVTARVVEKFFSNISSFKSCANAISTLDYQRNGYFCEFICCGDYRDVVDCQYTACMEVASHKVTRI